MKKEILFVLLKDLADRAGANFAPKINADVAPGTAS